MWNGRVTAGVRDVHVGGRVDEQQRHLDVAARDRGMQGRIAQRVARDGVEVRPGSQQPLDRRTLTKERRKVERRPAVVRIRVESGGRTRAAGARACRSRPPRRRQRCRAGHPTAPASRPLLAACCTAPSSAVSRLWPAVAAISAGSAATSRRSDSTSPVRAASKNSSVLISMLLREPGRNGSSEPPGATRTSMRPSATPGSPSTWNSMAPVCFDRRAGDARGAHPRREMRRPRDQPACVPEPRQRGALLHDCGIEQPSSNSAPGAMRAPSPYSRPLANAMSSARTVPGSPSSCRR